MSEPTKGISAEVRELGTAGLEVEGEDADEAVHELICCGVEGETRKANELEIEERFEDRGAGLAMSEYLLNAASNPSSKPSSSTGRGMGTLQSLSWIHEGRPVMIQSRYSKEYNVYHIRTRISFSASLRSGTSLRRLRPRV